MTTSIPESREALHLGDDQNLDRVRTEIDELVRLNVLTSELAQTLKHRLSGRVVASHLQDGMTITEIIDMHRDLLGQ